MTHRIRGARLKTFTIFSVVRPVRSGLCLRRKDEKMPRRNSLHARGRSVSTRATIEAMEGRTLLSTYTVTNTNDSGTGSLRQAILDANKTTATDTIKFAIGSGAKTITPKSHLPGIENPVTIDGTTQPGFSNKPIVELNGSSAGSGSYGLKLIGSGITIKGLIINRFSGDGIFIYNHGGDKVVGCWIGVDKTGTLDQGNGGKGIMVQSPNNTIGGTTAGERNVISGNTNAGVFYYLAAASHNKVLGNFIGTDYTG